jgi:hypothetical protein
VFDLKNFLEIVSDLKKDNDTELNCPICSVNCTYFNYDKEIYNAIQNFSEYDEKKPEGISIERSGEFYWIGDSEGDGDALDSNDVMLDEDDQMNEEKDEDAIS